MRARGTVPLRVVCACPSRAEIVACAATLRTRGGGTSVSPASCESPPPPLGRAARVRVSDAFHLPPNCYCDRQGIGCHPKGCASTRPERRLHENGGRKPCIASTPASRVRQKTKLPRCYRKSNFSTECGRNLFAVAGTREHPMAGVIHKRGQGHLLCACRAQRHRPRRPQAAKSLPA